MSSDPLGDEGRAAQETPSRSPVEPAYHRWLGHPVLLNYSKASASIAEDALFEIAKGAVEGREAVFLLEEAGSVGVLVRRLLGDEGRDDDLSASVFMPWSAIHSMVSLVEDGEGDEAPD